ncbi:MAG: hemolysin III family protein [Thermoanaerobaculales bacterium]|nr:hemolysin III family protein [Thermoanaerobaculales bacterium]
MLTEDCRTESLHRSRYSLGEEIANSVTHGIGWLLSAGGVGLLVTLAALTGGAMRIVSVSVFGVTLVLLYAASTMYHALANERAKRVFKILDHSAIFLLIAGTYTPLALVRLGGPRGWILFGGIWFLAVVGVLITALRIDSLRWLAVILYVAMGWSVVVVLKPLFAVMETSSLVLLIAGGLAYTLGLVFFLWRRLPYGHMVWHLFVLCGSVLHFIAILFAVAL